MLLRRVSTVGNQTGQHRVDEGLKRIHCGENCVGLKPKQPVIGAYKRKSNRLRSAVNVSKCGHNVTGALLGCRFHNPKVGGSIPPPATNLPIYFQRLTTNWRSGGESPYRFLL